MTLLITIFAGIVSTVVWYIKSPNNHLYLGSLSLIFWGASLMWFVDAVTEFIQMHSQFFTPSIEEMLNDTYLGLSVVALGLIIWLVILLIKDPKKIRKIDFGKNR